MDRSPRPTRVRRWLAAVAYNMSIDCLRGERASGNRKAAFRLNRDAARAGYRHAQFAMGWFYYNGIGVERDLRKARSWYRIAAENGEPGAAFSLGQLALDRRDYGSAAAWFQRAVCARHGRAAYYLGRLYLDGHGIGRDIRRAGVFLERAAKSGVGPARRLLQSKRFRSANRPRRGVSRRT